MLPARSFATCKSLRVTPTRVRKLLDGDAKLEDMAQEHDQTCRSERDSSREAPAFPWHCEPARVGRIHEQDRGYAQEQLAMGDMS